MANAPSSFLKDSLGQKTAGTVSTYVDYHDEREEDDRRAGYEEMVNAYYDLVTDFYEYGWGESFHFAPRLLGESFMASLVRHQHYLAMRLGLKRGMRVLDVGCGVGGPMREVARISEASVVGINNNAYQVKRGEMRTEKAGLSHRCSFIKGDFMAIPEGDGSFDAAFAVEATCHAPDRAKCYGEIRRVLKPGGLFAAYEWVLTDRYDGSAEHDRIRDGIEKGNGLPRLTPAADVLESLDAAGFDVVEKEDRALSSHPDFPWYLPLSGRGYGPRELLMKPAGRWMTHHLVGMLEQIKLVPEGSQKVSGLLNDAAIWLVKGGETGIFTPMYFFLARARA